MQLIPSSPSVAHLGSLQAPVRDMLQPESSCKPATVAPRLHAYTGRDAAALMETRPVLLGGEGARTSQRSEVE